MRITSWAVAVLLLCTSRAVQAGTVTLTFSGTYDTFGQTIYGLSGSAVPFSYQITYDPALDTNTWFFPTGATVDGKKTTHPYYGYSASGITASNIAFGTGTFTAADLVARFPGGGSSADLWFDTDISVAAPTRCWMYFYKPDSNGILQLGEGNDFLTTIEMGKSTYIKDAAGETELAPLTITSSVPEPGTVAIAAFAAAVVLLSNRKRDRKSA